MEIDTQKNKELLKLSEKQRESLQDQMKVTSSNI